VIFHVQTEDSGQQNPHLFTHLFHEGVIVSTRKYVYDAGSNEEAIKGLMQAQHKAVMKDLRRGTFDDKIDSYLSGVPGLEPRAGADPNAPRPRGERAPTEVSAPPEEVLAAETVPTAAPQLIEITQDDLSQPIELPVKQRTKTAERTSKSAVKAPNEPPPPMDDAPTYLDRGPIVRFQTPPPTLGNNPRESSPILEMTIDDDSQPNRMGSRDTNVESMLGDAIPRAHTDSIPGQTVPVSLPPTRPPSHNAAALPPMKSPSRPSITPPVVTSRPAPVEAINDDAVSQPIEIYAPAPPSVDPPPGERSERPGQYSVNRRDGSPIREQTGRIAAVNPNANANAIPSGLARPQPPQRSDSSSNRAAIPPNVQREPTPGNRPVPPATPRPTPSNIPGRPPPPNQQGRGPHVTSPITNRTPPPAIPAAGSGVVMTRPAVIVGAPPKPPATQPPSQRIRKAREDEGRGFGQGLISEKSLDEVILAYLSEDAEEK
jgi:hypothetical protein